jgi:hypothetical protein
MLDDDLLKKLRTNQAKMIKQTNKSVSLSRVINEYLEVNLKNGKA